MAGETHSNLLDGALLKYTYAELGTVIVKFYDGLISFEWVDGPMAGQLGEDFPYRATRFTDQQFIANWHEPETHAFVTLVIDLRNDKVFSSVLAAYGSAEEQVWLHEADLHEARGLA